MKKISYGGAVTGFAEQAAIIKSIDKSRKTANWQQAEEGALMEKELCAYLGVNHAVLTNSGSSAGLLALSALEIPKGSEVIIPAVTFPTIFNIIPQCGLVPVVVDSKIGTYNLDPDELESAISPLTKAVIVVQAVGNIPDLVKIRAICDKHGLKLILDNCDGLGGTLHGKKVETYADVAFTSFHAAHIVSMGVGGGIFTNDADLAQNVRMYRDWGRQANPKERWNGDQWPNLPKDQDSRFIYEKVGYNFQILELQAAMGRVQLKKIDRIKEARRKNVEYLVKHLSKYPDLVMPKVTEGADVCWFSFPLTTKGNRASLVKHLEDKGIETRSMFAGNVLKHPAFVNTESRDAGVNEANYILEHSFWISCHPRLTKIDLKYIVKTFDEYYASIA